jgi:glycosyltransferase involved in cell wall biosynthesis
MRALFVNHTGGVSGGELSLLALLANLPPEVEPVVACPEGPLAHRVRALGIDVQPICGTDGSLRLHPTRTPRAIFDIARAGRQVRKAAEGANADVVHANSIRAGIIATGGGVSRGRPTVVHVRDCLPPGRLSAVSLRAISRADALVANSNYTAAALRQEERVFVVHNGVDLDQFSRRMTHQEARVRLGLTRGRPVLAVLAQITPWKGQDDAIEIAAQLIRSHPDLQLLLVGSPKFTSASTRFDNTGFFEALRALVNERKLSAAVHFLGEREDVPEVLSAVDLLLVPSWEEPFGRAIIEAMAMGVPVVATNVGGPSEILVEGECGLVLPPREPEAWAREIDGLLSAPARLAEMGERGEAAARRRFDMRAHVEGVMRVYESVLATPAATA